MRTNTAPTTTEKLTEYEVRIEPDAESFRAMGLFGCGKRGVIKFGGCSVLVRWPGQREKGQLS